MTPDMQLTVTAAYIAMQIGAVKCVVMILPQLAVALFTGLQTAATYIGERPL